MVREIHPVVSMNLQQVMTELEALGRAQVRKIIRNNGGLTTVS